MQCFAFWFVFFFQAEDGIRDLTVTGVQTCALPIPIATTWAPATPGALVPPLGNLDAYISAVNRLPMLTLEEEQDYARKLKEHSDLDAAGRLVMSHLRLVVSISRQYLGYGLPHEIGR